MLKHNNSLSEEHISLYESQIEELQDEVDRLNKVVDDIHASRSWRLLSPIRVFRRYYLQYINFVRIIFVSKHHFGGIFPLIKKSFDILQQDGWFALKDRIQGYVNKRDVAFPESSPVESGLPRIEKKDIKRPSILFVSHEASRTGAPIFLLNLMRYIVANLNVELIILLRRGGELEPEFRALGKTVHLSNPNKLDGKTRSWLKKQNIKLIYVNTISNGNVQAQLQDLNSPLLCHVHELAFSMETFYGNENLQRVKRATTRFLAGSQVVADTLVHLLNIPPQQISLAYPFIDVQRNRRIVHEEERPMAIELDTIVVGSCGTLTWRKGPDIFLQVARLVKQKAGHVVKFVWVGGPLSGNEYISLRHDAGLMNIQESLVFTGSVSSHIPYLAQFDIFLLPSREDPFPLVALDAASLGIPVVCFERAGGAPEMVEDDAGIIIPYLDVEGMADSVITLIENPALRKKLGERASEKIVERFDIMQGAQRILQIIKEHLPQSLE